MHPSRIARPVRAISKRRGLCQPKLRSLRLPCFECSSATRAAARIQAILQRIGNDRIHVFVSGMEKEGTRLLRECPGRVTHCPLPAGPFLGLRTVKIDTSLTEQLSADLAS